MAIGAFASLSGIGGRPTPTGPTVLNPAPFGGAMGGGPQIFEVPAGGGVPDMYTPYVPVESEEDRKRREAVEKAQKDFRERAALMMARPGRAATILTPAAQRIGAGLNITSKEIANAQSLLV